MAHMSRNELDEMPHPLDDLSDHGSTEKKPRDSPPPSYNGYTEYDNMAMEEQEISVQL